MDLIGFVPPAYELLLDKMKVAAIESLQVWGIHAWQVLRAGKWPWCNGVNSYVSIGNKQIKAGSIGYKQIKAGSIGCKQIKAGSIGIKQIKAGSIGYKQIKVGSMGYKQIHAGSIGNKQIKAGERGRSIVSPASGLYQWPKAKAHKAKHTQYITHYYTRNA